MKLQCNLYVFFKNFKLLDVLQDSCKRELKNHSKRKGDGILSHDVRFAEIRYYRASLHHETSASHK